MWSDLLLNVVVLVSAVMVLLLLRATLFYTILGKGYMVVYACNNNNKKYC